MASSSGKITVQFDKEGLREFEKLVERLEKALLGYKEALRKPKKKAKK